MAASVSKTEFQETLGIDPSKIETRLFIDGEFVNSASGKTFPAENPANQKVICQVQEGDKADVDLACAAATKAFENGAEWRTCNPSVRRNKMLKLAELMERDSDYFMALEALDNGKPLAPAGSNIYGTSTDIYLGIECIKYYAGWADKIEGKQIPVDGAMMCYTVHEPVGVVGQIIPWNFPLVMLCWKWGPALATGCTIVMKSSEKTPLSALHMATLAKEAGFPNGVVNVLSGFGPTCGDAIVRHPQTHKIAFTGSTKVGKLIQSLAANHMKTVTLECGGKSPLIVFDDADLEQAVNAADVGLFLNQGQCCIAASRLYVQEGIYDKFVEMCVAKAQKRTLGNQSSGAEQGPQVDGIQFDNVLKFIQKGKDEGATLLTGGDRHGKDGEGYYVQPTVFSDVTDDMTIAREEIFGPVMSIMKFKTVEEVVKRANDTMYGLGAGVCTRDIGKAMVVSSQIRAGTIYINCYDNFTAQAPFGGMKQSGIGRELGEYGIRAYIEPKTVFIPMDMPKLK